MEEEATADFWQLVETGEADCVETHVALVPEGRLYRTVAWSKEGFPVSVDLVFVPRDQGYTPRRSGGG